MKDRIDRNPEAEKLAYYPWFDWLRIASASAVVLAHEGLIPWDRAGNLAVLTFFALSGWLIGGILLKTRPAELPRFYYNRGTRIWVPYAFAVAAIYLVGALREGAGPLFWKHLFLDLTFTHNWFTFYPDVVSGAAGMPLKGTGAHFWSIAVEEQFYLVAPLVMLFSGVGRQAWFWIAVAVLMMLFGWNAAPIGLGVAAATLQQARPDWHRGPAAVAATLVIALASTLVIGWDDRAYPYAAPVFAIAAVLLCAVPGRRGRIGGFLGGMSYPLYLFHWTGAFAANFVAKRLGLTGAGVGFAGYAVAVLVGAAAYLVVDRNIQRYRGRLFTARRGRAFAATAYGLALVGMAGGGLYMLAVAGRGPLAGTAIDGAKAVEPAAPGR